MKRGSVIRHNRQGEEVVIYTLLLRPEDFLAATGGRLPNAEWFQIETHKELVQIVYEMIQENVSITPAVALARMRNDSENWFYEMAERMEMFPSLDIKHIMKNLNDSYAKTQLQKFANESSHLKSLNGVTDKLTEIVSKFQYDLSTKSESATAAFSALLSDIHENREEKTYSTPYNDLNVMMCGGLRAGEMMIVAARPGVGKSALALNIAGHLADNGHRTLFSSMEMSISQISVRLLSTRCEIPVSKLRMRTLTQTHLDRITKESRVNIPLFLTDKCFTLAELEQEIILNDIEVVIVDYIQLLGAGDSENRQCEVASISRRLKQIALRRKIAVIVLSQLNREIERRANQTPVLSDLRESGQLEQDADQVIFLNRPGAFDDDSEDTACELIVAKHRQGATGRVQLDWRPEICSFF